MRTKGYIEGLDRDQYQLLPPCVDEYIEAGNAVRFIEAFVESLDMVELGFSHHTPCQTGAPSYRPQVLLALYIYGYLWSITSSRLLEVEAKRNVELMWLLRGLRPDHQTISRFRKDNTRKFKQVFRAFNGSCRELQLFSRQVAIDGSKFKASNSKGNYLKRSTSEKEEAKAAERVKKYMEALDAADASHEEIAADATLSKAELESKLKYWQKKQEQAKATLEQLDAAGKDELATTDQDSRWMKDRHHGNGKPGFNVQGAVDTESHLIVEVDVVNEQNDAHQLGSMAKQTQQQLGIDKEDEAPLQVLADTGYHEASELEKCAEANIKAIVSAPATTGGQAAEGKQVYSKKSFLYQENTDSYRCPGEAILERHKESHEGDKTYYHYSNKAACAGCSLKSLCTTAEHRTIKRRSNEVYVERAAQVYSENKEVFRKRKSTIEHVFGTFRNRGQDEFRLRGKENVLGEISLSALAYNITRAINLVGIGVLIEVLKGRKLAVMG